MTDRESFVKVPGYNPTHHTSNGSDTTTRRVRQSRVEALIRIVSHAESVTVAGPQGASLIDQMA